MKERRIILEPDWQRSRTHANREGVHEFFLDDRNTYDLINDRDEQDWIVLKIRAIGESEFTEKAIEATDKSRAANIAERASKR